MAFVIQRLGRQQRDVVADGAVDGGAPGSKIGGRIRNNCVLGGGLDPLTPNSIRCGDTSHEASHLDKLTSPSSRTKTMTTGFHVLRPEHLRGRRHCHLTMAGYQVRSKK
jgi:hypothetical protein